MAAAIFRHKNGVLKHERTALRRAKSNE